MYKPIFNKRQVLVFRQFGNKGYSLFSCLGREVVCSVLSVATLTYASAESVSTDPVVTDSTATTTAREMMLEEVSVTGSRAPLTKSQAARMVTVLDRQAIAQAPVQSVNDLLKYAIGVDVRQRGPIGAQTDISIRGGTSEQIIVLLNGINICDPQTGHNVMDLPVDLHDIVRIEVIEGPAGRIYGTSSLVGAINVVTRERGEWREVRGKRYDQKADIHAEGGSYGYAHAGFRYSLTSYLSPLTSNISANYSRCDGWSRAKEGGLNTDFSGGKAFYQGQYEGKNLQLHWHAGMADKGWGSSTFWASPKWQADNQYEHTTKIFTALQGETKWGRLHIDPSIYWNQNRDRYEGYRGQPEKMAFNYNRTNVWGVSISGYFDWSQETGDRSQESGDRSQESGEVEVEIVTEFKSAPRPEVGQMLPGVKNIIAVSSGKGGVGKSTVSANLAIALARLGYRVGLLDTDIFGPSMPKMFDVEDERPYAVKKDGRDLICPIEKYGVKLLSIGFFVSPTTATLWRGGMATSALKQLIADADWGELDYFILDTPPGTSDIHLTLLQTLPITGAVIVSTPQQVALADARKGIDMYRNEKVNVPILGLIENMAWFTPAELPENKYYIFGKEGCKQLAEEMNVPLLAQIPLVQSICDNGDAGTPAALSSDTATGLSFINLAQAVVTVVNRRNREQPQTKIVGTKS